jgi:iron complex transport system ATP-binding protein
MMRRVKEEEKGLPALSLRGVAARYPGAARGEALAHADLTVEPGELVFVLGPNGAGKSTLLRVLSGLLEPSAGEVQLFGTSLPAMDRRAVARVLAVVPQDDEVAFGFTVREVVRMGRAPHQGAWMRGDEEDARAVERAIAECDLGALAERPAQELSAGERKRVAIARALAQAPRVLLLDEPTSTLDVRHQISVFDLLAQKAAEEGLTCLAVVHDLNLAAQYASKVVLMKDGRVTASGTVADVMTYRRLGETFDADLYCGENDVTGARFFLPMRGKARA